MIKNNDCVSCQWGFASLQRKGDMRQSRQSISKNLIFKTLIPIDFQRIEVNFVSMVWDLNPRVLSTDTVTFALSKKLAFKSICVLEKIQFCINAIYRSTIKASNSKPRKKNFTDAIPPNAPITPSNTTFLKKALNVTSCPMALPNAPISAPMNRPTTAPAAYIS